MADIFISYSHPDRDLAGRVAAGLISGGASVWWDRELIGGDDFDSTILRELTAAKCVIVLWTATSVQSKYVRDEAQVALDAAKLIPVAPQGIDPPLGFRRVHLLRFGAVGPEEIEFARSLRRSVEARIDRTLVVPSQKTETTDAPPSSADASTRTPIVDQPPGAPVIIPVASAFKTIAMAAQCVWIGAHDAIEIRELPDGNLLGRSKADADALLGSPDGESVICFDFGVGYQSPDSIAVTRCKLKRSIPELQKGIRAAAEDPGDWHTSREDNIRYALSDAIEQSRLFVTWAWQPNVVALSDDGSHIAVYVDDPQHQIQLWAATKSDSPALSVAIGDHSPVEVVILNDGRLAILERRGKEQISHLSLWRPADGQRIAEYDLERTNANTLCGTVNPDHVALGLDQSIAVLHAQTGALKAQIEIESRQVRKIRFDSQSRRFGVLTDQHLVAIDAVSMRILGYADHGCSNGMSCDLRNNCMAALVSSSDRYDAPTSLVLWDTATLAQ